MDERLAKVVVGLALESALVHGRDTQTLVSLYSAPDLERVRELHDQLITAIQHHDREVAIWLEPALELGPLKTDPRGLVAEMREMEFVLNLLISRSGGAQREVNDWMNFIVNAAQSIEDRFWIDAKVLLSRALERSRRASVEQLKSDPGLRYEVDVLQGATAGYFEEMKGYPLRLGVPEDKLDAILKVQEIMLELMQIHYRGEQRIDAKITRPPIHRLSAAIRYLMDEKGEPDAAKREIRLASEHLETRLNEIVDEKRRELISVYYERIKEVAKTFEEWPPHISG